MSGANYIIFDGRQDGAGSTKSLTISNTNTSGTTIRFINDACNNTVKYCNVQGQNTAAGGAVILFSTAAAGGNDNNTIDNCDVNAMGVCQTAIYSLGSAAPNNNSENIIQNCSVRDFYSTTLANMWGIYLDAGNTSWIIQGNSIFQTAARDYSMYGIWIADLNGNGFTINNNFIGGNAANCAGTWTMTGALQNEIFGILVSVGNATPTNIQGNVITNFNIATKPTDDGTTVFWN